MNIWRVKFIEPFGDALKETEELRAELKNKEKGKEKLEIKETTPSDSD